jgi:hypothetical protein
LFSFLSKHHHHHHQVDEEEVWEEDPQPEDDVPESVTKDLVWKVLWKELEKVGWSYKKGGGLIDWIYKRPAGQTNKKIINKDYFCSANDVIEYVRKICDRREKAFQESHPELKLTKNNEVFNDHENFQNEKNSKNDMKIQNIQNNNMNNNIDMNNNNIKPNKKCDDIYMNNKHNNHDDSNNNDNDDSDNEEVFNSQHMDDDEVKEDSWIDKVSGWVELDTIIYLYVFCIL